MSLALLLLPLAAGCQSPAPEQAAGQQSPIFITDIRPGTPVEEMLLHLDQQLVRAIAGDMEGSSVDNFLRAEAVSDRLLEARLPFEWIAADEYSLQARLRQIQSGADRVMAQLETNAPRDSMLADLRALRADVLNLRQALTRGGGSAPIPLRQLLSADSARARVPRPPAAGATTAPTPPRPDTVITTTGA